MFYLLWGHHYFLKGGCKINGVKEIKDPLMESERHQATSDGEGGENVCFFSSGLRHHYINDKFC